MKKLYHTFPKVVGSEITSEKHLFNRRNIIAGIGSSMWLAKPSSGQSPTDPSTISTIPSKVSGTSIIDQPTPFEDATSYNNYYEFGLDKESPKKNAQKMSVSPWEIQMEGLVKKPGTWTLEQLLKLAPMEERIYRLRCVEGWSMVIPWVGYSLSNLIQKLEPLGQAKYVSFETLSDKKTMPYINSRVLQWPYIEGLRLDEAMHPLTLLTFGMYGKLLPNQNGAPVRLVVPWKYGFKSAKSIVKIRISAEPPITAWNRQAPQEYGFYANVNPEVDHPRWSQASERIIGASGFSGKRRKTQLFNGYQEQVASLYSGLDLRKNF